MTRFRRMTTVPNDAVNLAYVSIPGASPSEIIGLLDPTGSSGREHRKIMYSDIAGRLVDINGNPRLSAAYPVITDIFFDKDNDRTLDADEVVPEAALPYRYKSRKMYYGKELYQTPGAMMREITLHTGKSGTSVNDFDGTMTTNFDASSLVGKKIKLKSVTFSGAVTANREAPPVVVGAYRTITAGTANSITYEYPFYEKDPVTGLTTGPDGIVSAITFDVVDLLPDQAPLFSLIGTEKIKLTNADGTPYTGRYKVFLQRAKDSEEVVTNGDEAGWGCSYIHVFLDRDDRDLVLHFPSASIADDGDGGYERVGNIDTDHSELVSAYEMFRYAPVSVVTDPYNEGEDLCASVTLGEGHGVYVTERAFIDERIIDQITWRVRADVVRSTPILSSTGQEELKVGVIGTVPKSLDKFLDDDPTYKFRMKCRNPYPSSIAGTSHWNVAMKETRKPGYKKQTDVHTEIDPSIKWERYDLVIFRNWNINWGNLFGIAAEVIRGGGTFLIDTADKNVRISGSDSKCPTELKLNLTTPFPAATTKSNISVATKLSDVPGGYDISTADIIKTFPVKPSTYIGYNAQTYWRRTDLVTATITGGSRKPFMTELVPGLVVSTIGFTEADNEPTKQFFCNFIWGYSIADSKMTSSTSSSTFSMYSPWQTSWLAGKNVKGEPILSEAEMEKFDFFNRLDSSTGEVNLVRKLSDKTAQELVKEAAVNKGNIAFMNGADSITYYLEVTGSDTAMIDYKESLSATSHPEAWSRRNNSPEFHVQPGYLLRSYFEELSPGVVPRPPVDIESTVRVVGTLVSLETNKFSFEFSEKYSYDSKYTVEVEKPLTADSGYVDFVTTWSDVNWTAPHIWEDHDVRSKKNLLGYGDKGITATLWYPWDGQSFLASLNRNHGEYVKYVQRALNALAEVDRGHRTGKLTVDGNYGYKTDKAVRDYQKRWELTVDGDVDAGTAGHMMRNAGTLTKWADLDDRWKKYGNMMNIVDGSDSTLSGRRTWINTKVTRMTDHIYIVLKDPMLVTKIEIEPYLLGEGAAKKMHIFRIGGRRASDHKKYDWSYDKSKDMEDAWQVKHSVVGEKKLTLPNKIDLIDVGLYQDNAHNGRSRMWGVKNVIAYGKVTTTRTKREYDRLDYNKSFKILRADINGTADTVTIKTEGRHGLNPGNKVYIDGLATTACNGSWTVKETPSADSFVYVVSGLSTTTTESNVGSSLKNMDISIRTGEKKVVTIKPELPRGATFYQWDRTEAEMEAAILASIYPEEERTGDVTVSVEFGDNGIVYIIFESPLNSNDAERSIGADLNVTMQADQSYGVDQDKIYGSATSSGNTTITDANKYWKTNFLAGGKITFTDGNLEGNTYNIKSNTATVITTFETMDVPADIPSSYIIDVGECANGNVKMTAGNGTANGTIAGLNGLTANSLIGYRVIFLEGSSDKKVSTITANTTTSITLADNLNIASGDDFVLILGHWPAFDAQDPDVAYSIVYRVDVVRTNGSVKGVFFVYDASGRRIKTLEQISLSDMIQYGFSNIKIGVTNLKMIGDPSIGGTERFPVRYAMKPYCVIEKTKGCDLDVLGVIGDEPSEVWGLRIEAATVKRDVRIPVNLCSADNNKNNLDEFSSITSDAVNKTAECIYAVTGANYSATHGEPFVDIVDERTETIEFDQSTGIGWVKTSFAPIHVDDDGTPVVTVDVDAQGFSAFIEDVDIEGGMIKFRTDMPNFSPELNYVKASYTYREQYISYKGGGVKNGVPDIFDLCPYHGHMMSAEDGLVSTSSLLGRPIYVYALPTTVKVDQTEITRSRAIYHTTYAPMFDPESPFFNPFVMLLSVITIKGISGKDTIMIDTRTGGGGIDAESIDVMLDSRFLHESGFYEHEGFYDIGYLDGKGYLLGGSVIIQLPLSWRDTWLGFGEEPDEMVRRFCRRWVAAGKSITVAWVNEDGTVDSYIPMDPSMEGAPNSIEAGFDIEGFNSEDFVGS